MTIKELMPYVSVIYQTLMKHKLLRSTLIESSTNFFNLYVPFENSSLKGREFLRKGLFSLYLPIVPNTYDYTIKLQN